MLFGTTCLACHGQLKRVIKPSTWVDSYASDAMTKVVCGELELSYTYTYERTSHPSNMKSWTFVGLVPMHLK